MRFWIRELAGWLLVGLGLYVFLICATMLLDPEIGWPQFIQAGPMIIIGFIVFRGGIHLLKVAIAARAVLHAQTEVSRQEKPTTRRPSRPAPWEE
jgi:hypothetical protein